MRNWFKSGAPWIWLTGGAVSVSLVAVVGLLALIAWRGLSFFWPSTVYEFDLEELNGHRHTVIGELYDSELVPADRIIDSGVKLPEGHGEMIERFLLKTGNREYVDLDFRWIMETQIKGEQAPKDIAVFERSTNGNFYGYVVGLQQGEQAVNVSDMRGELIARMERAIELNGKADDLQHGPIGKINYRLERMRLEERGLELKGQLDAAAQQKFVDEREQLQQDYLVLEKELFAFREQASRDSVIVKDMDGREVNLPMAKILDVYFPNDMGFFAKFSHWVHQLVKFVVSEPREANTEGGVFPAIFGTVFMVMLMAVIVTPLGVVAAIYLHEYAKKGPITKMIRIAVINLAGVPSIVYGVFGLGFFVYMLGGSLDQLFYPEALPSPTFGSPGVIWSALTLAILTLPVVIVSTEEGLSRIPSSVRQGSLALGATKAETLWRIIIPMASPAIMTGLILAVARAAGEVAPLMLVGVVKMAPTLPLDGNFPYFHLERKFMHLGFHIYDVGFQSPNVEAARPLVYATAFLLVTVIVGLNMAAIGIRNHLREKFRSLDQ
ncbi:phosphate ABC transporter permease PstA [Motilimonas pumila]|uniref:Phosphate transport system permease protein PstA n=1 Tax=Motilimonas pumila TaxID=2303987 RepID=A0A418YKD1_9GAMM|nr:phosphate ABC transporter permease PstA [Motilimonas pumila]RJG51290.1 phosphate ABC transporter permease PstA [Motilimonas pumila]